MKAYDNPEWYYSGFRKEAGKQNIFYCIKCYETEDGGYEICLRIWTD